MQCCCARNMLFDATCLMTHELGQGQSSFKRHKQGDVAEQVSDCTSYFIEPVSWMLPMLEGNMDGKVTCSCWISNMHCSYVAFIDR